LLTASGVSDKAVTHLQPQDKTEAIQGLIKNFLDSAGASFVEELIFRFLLTRGDTLGGSMRNTGGVLAQRKLIARDHLYRGCHRKEDGKRNLDLFRNWYT
jgi:hypothetical protein